jgi:hypothetical protein
MAITSIKTGSSFTNLTKYDSFLAGNTAFNPSSYESIATFTASGGETSTTFSSIASTYKALQLRVIYRDTTGVAGTYNLRLQFNGDTTGANYVLHYLQGNGSAVSALGSTANGYIELVSFGATGGTAASIFGVGICDIQDYASTTKNKTVRAFGGRDANVANTTSTISLSSGLWLSTSAINSMQVIPADTAFAAGTTIALYGIKGA